jgi:dienelactone hydrolase
MQLKDAFRSINYLETRKDIDTSRIGFYGVSLGAGVGTMISYGPRRVPAVKATGRGCDYRRCHSEKQDPISSLGARAPPNLTPRAVWQGHADRARGGPMVAFSFSNGSTSGLGCAQLMPTMP